MQEILPQEAIVHLTTAQTISHAGDFPPTGHSESSHQTSFEDTFHHCRHQCLLLSILDPSPGSSLPPFFSSALKHQIAALLATKEKKFSVHFMDVQMQAGGDDCGVFAIAFATALCCGHPPGKFQFHQRAMPHHFIRCFERGQFTMFPVHRSRCNENRVKSTKIVAVFCSCRMPELSGTEMIQCSRCREWLH